MGVAIIDDPVPDDADTDTAKPPASTKAGFIAERRLLGAAKEWKKDTVDEFYRNIGKTQPRTDGKYDKIDRRRKR